jgi:hypothetical protein
MIRIVAIERNADPNAEFVLLQNQGVMRQNLRGHALFSDAALCGGISSEAWHIFSEEVQIPPGAYILVHSGAGQDRWARTKDGSIVYYCYLSRSMPVWHGLNGTTHLLNTQHQFCETKPHTLVTSAH